MADFWDVVNPSSTLSSIVLGWAIGAFYGFSLARDKPIVYPYALWIVGLGFVLMLAVNIVLNGQGTWGFAIGRSVLWTILCIFVPIGRYSRVRWEHRQIARKIRMLRRRR